MNYVFIYHFELLVSFVKSIIFQFLASFYLTFSNLLKKETEDCVGLIVFFFQIDIL